ncbi:MAG TPA: hypothetical protein VGE10_14745 [Zeimonas sp.]
MRYTEPQPASIARSPRHAPGPALLLAAASLGVSAPAAAVPGDSATWDFNLPATALESQEPPYPTVASLMLFETTDGVQFTLSPTWTEAPTGRFASSSQIERVDYVYGGSPLTDFTPSYPSLTSNASFRWDGGAPVRSFGFSSSASMDAGYATNVGQVTIDFFHRNGDPDADRFDSSFGNSVWTVLGATLTDFTGPSASANAKPSPTHGVLSVTGYSLDGLTPTPSNWVTGAADDGDGDDDVPFNPVPAPGLLSLLGIGLLAAGTRVRRS